MAFPDTIDTLPTTNTDATVSEVTHSEQHNRANSVLNALQTVLQAFFSTAGQLSVAGNVVATGALQGASAAITGALTAASSTLTGALSAATATFSGTGATSINTAGGITAAGDLNCGGGYRQVVDAFYQDNMAASSGPNTMNADHLSTYNATVAYATRAGSVTALLVSTSASPTAGTLTCRVRINGVAQTATATVIDTSNPRQRVTYVGKDTVPFVVGDRIEVEWQTSATWAPTNNDVRATVEIET